jgi:hypothetical protein
MKSGLSLIQAKYKGSSPPNLRPQGYLRPGSRLFSITAGRDALWRMLYWEAIFLRFDWSTDVSLEMGVKRHPRISDLPFRLSKKLLACEFGIVKG